MPDDLVQQAVQNAPVVGAGSLVGGGGLIAVLRFFKIFATPQDIELVEARLRAEFSEKYLAKEAVQPLMDEIRHIRDRVDQLFERKS